MTDDIHIPLLKPEQVPDAAAIAHCAGDVLGLDMSDPEERAYYENAVWNAKVDIAAAINAWPGMMEENRTGFSFTPMPHGTAFCYTVLILPLPQETRT